MSTDYQTVIAANLVQVEERIQAACDLARRKRGEVVLVAVSKTRTLDEIRAVLACGMTNLGENRIEELETKVPAVQQMQPAHSPTWHMIGHIQSRKAERAVAISDMIHGVDSVRLAHRIERAAREQGKRLAALIEVNVSGEASKYGFAAHDEPSVLALIEDLRSLGALRHLEIQGLMTMAPIVTSPELARPVFRRLAALRQRFRAELPFSDWAELSMGMTDDFDVAIQEGATMVRIGRAIFGPRTYTENDVV